MKGKMSRLQRAKQFMPFAALRGFEEMLAKVATYREDKVELSDDQMELLNRMIQRMKEGDWIRLVYYNGRRYTEIIGQVEWLHHRQQTVVIKGHDITFSSIKEINFY